MACWQRIPSISGSRELDFPPTIVPCADHRLSSLLAGIKAPIRSDASASAPAPLRKNIDRCGRRRECKMIKAEANQQRRNHDAAVLGLQSPWNKEISMCCVLEVPLHKWPCAKKLCLQICWRISLRDSVLIQNEI